MMVLSVIESMRSDRVSLSFVQLHALEASARDALEVVPL